MAELKYKVLPEGYLAKECYNPLTLVLLDADDIRAAGITVDEAIKAVAKTIEGPAGIDVYDRSTVTTTSDGIMAECAMIAFAASDRGRINPRFGKYDMIETEYDPALEESEPCLCAWQKLYPGRRLFRGPRPDQKEIAFHNATITGRACNNNSASEIMNLETMKEMLFPFLGLRSLFYGEPALVGHAGGPMSVSIGMMVPEMNGRIAPTPLCEAGDTLHNCGEYAQTLKEKLPTVACKKELLIDYIAKHLEAGMVPGINISVAPSILAVACLMDKPVAWDRITDRAWIELESVGCTKEYYRSLEEKHMSLEEIKAIADEIVPGMKDAVEIRPEDVLEERTLTV